MSQMLGIIHARQRADRTKGLIESKQEIIDSYVQSLVDLVYQQAAEIDRLEEENKQLKIRG